MIASLICTCLLGMLAEVQPLSKGQEAAVQHILGYVPDPQTLEAGVLLPKRIIGTIVDAEIDFTYELSFSHLKFKDGKLLLLDLNKEGTMRPTATFVESSPLRFDPKKSPEYMAARREFGESRGGIEGWGDEQFDHTTVQWALLTLREGRLMYYDVFATLVRKHGEELASRKIETFSIKSCELTFFAGEAAPVTAATSHPVKETLLTRLESNLSNDRASYFGELNKIRESPTLHLQPLLDGFADDLSGSNTHLRTLLLGKDTGLRPWKSESFKNAIATCIQGLTSKNLEPELIALLLECCGGGHVLFPITNFSAYSVEVEINPGISIRRTYDTLGGLVTIEDTKAKLLEILAKRFPTK